MNSKESSSEAATGANQSRIGLDHYLHIFMIPEFDRTKASLLAPWVWVLKQNTTQGQTP